MYFFLPSQGLVGVPPCTVPGNSSDNTTTLLSLEKLSASAVNSWFRPLPLGQDLENKHYTSIDPR